MKRTTPLLKVSCPTCY